MIRSASEFWKAQTRWRQRIEAFAVEKLLPLKNERWLEDDEEAVSEAELQDALSLSEIVFRSTGEFECSFVVGELFFGHGAQISGTLEEGPTKASLYG